MSRKNRSTHHSTNKEDLHFDTHGAVNEQFYIQKAQQEFKTRMDEFADTFSDDLPNQAALREEREQGVAQLLADNEVLRQFFEPIDSL